MIDHEVTYATWIARLGSYPRPLRRNPSMGTKNSSMSVESVHRGPSGPSGSSRCCRRLNNIVVDDVFLPEFSVLILVAPMNYYPSIRF